jgi:hypothetical protein
MTTHSNGQHPTEREQPRRNHTYPRFADPRQNWNLTRIARSMRLSIFFRSGCRGPGALHPPLVSTAAKLEPRNQVDGKHELAAARAVVIRPRTECVLVPDFGAQAE